MYYDRAEALAKIPNHRVLAINRGEKEKKLKVKLSLETEKIHELIAESVIRNEKSIFYEMLQGTIADAYKRLMAPSIEREMRNMLTERAEAEAVKIFAKNTESLLMTPPVRGKKVIAIDPGYRTGCKVAVLDETGKLKAYDGLSDRAEEGCRGYRGDTQKDCRKVPYGHHRGRQRNGFARDRRSGRKLH